MKTCKKNGALTSFSLLFFFIGFCQENDALLKDSGWSYHIQFTGILQGHPSFHTQYSGRNSVNPEHEKAFSVTSTLYLGRTLWKGASIYFNPEMAGGKGVSSTLGIAGFPNGETFRIGDPEPTVYIGRIFLQQQINLDKDHYEYISDDVNTVRGKVSTSRLTLSLGKFSIADFFDDNNVSHDPRSDFLNWALMSNGAYDYAANTRGYTYGLVAELIKPGWALRAGTALMPDYANGPTLDPNYFKTSSETLEFEKKILINRRPGAIRLLGYFNITKAPAYNQLVADKLSGADTAMDAIYGKKYGGKKYGLAINAEQEFTNSLHAFLRAGWNDGKTATWAFTEIDNTISAGIRIYGNGWKRKTDNIGIALLSNGISTPHRNFLNAGGYGFLIGDGKLPHYTRENIVEVFYQAKLLRDLYITADYQLINHPAYNKDNGTMHLFAGRLHLEF